MFWHVIVCFSVGLFVASTSKAKSESVPSNHQIRPANSAKSIRMVWSFIGRSGKLQPCRFRMQLDGIDAEQVPVAIVARLPSTCLLRSHGFLGEWPRLLEDAQCRRGLVVMFLRIPHGCVLLQKSEQFEKSFLDT